jgi:hypothetical protein
MIKYSLFILLVVCATYSSVLCAESTNDFEAELRLLEATTPETAATAPIKHENGAADTLVDSVNLKSSAVKKPEMPIPKGRRVPSR